MIQALLSVIISAALSFGAVLGYQSQQPAVSPAIQHAIQQYVNEAVQGPIFGTTQPIAGQTYNLSGPGVSQTGTSITLASFTIPQNGYKIPDSALSDTFYITLEPGNPTKQEIVSCTTDTQNANGTATFTGCVRGLSPIPDYTSSSSLKFSHGGGTQVIFSNPPQFYAEFALLQNTESITGTWTFATSPLLTTDCTGGSSSNSICGKSYIDSVAVAGASNASETVKGIVELATGVEAASSTSLGATGARLALAASLATSSPWAGATTTVVVTGLDGRINPTFISTSTSVTYSMGNLFVGASTTIAGSATTVGTTTMSANVATGKGLCLNGVCYTEPSVQGAANSVLVNDGTGKKTWGSVPKLSNVGATGASLATTGYATSSTQIVIPAGSLTSSSTIEIYGGGSLSTASGSSASACTVLVRSSTGVTLASFSLNTAAADGSSMSFTYHAFITATSTTASQYTYIAGLGVDAGLGAGSGVSTAIDTLGNTGINFANAVTLTMVIQETVASKSCSIGNVQYIVNL